MTKITLIRPEPDPDPMGTMYRVVRDATVCGESCSNAQKIAILELVKAEIVRYVQAEIDAE